MKLKCSKCGNYSLLYYFECVDGRLECVDCKHDRLYSDLEKNQIKKCLDTSYVYEEYQNYIFRYKGR